MFFISSVKLHLLSIFNIIMFHLKPTPLSLSKIYTYVYIIVCPPSGVEKWGPGGRFTKVEGDQRRGRSSGVGDRVGGMASGWRWRKRSVQVTVGPGGEAPWLEEAHRRRAMQLVHN